MDMNINQLLDIMLDKRASDLHISADLPPMVRIDGEMMRLDLPVMDKDNTYEIITSILTEEQKIFYTKNKELDLAYSYSASSRFRVNAFTTYRGPAAVLRAIPTKIQTLEDLKTPEILKKLCHAPRGLVLVTGPTGSGKSTTLA